MKPKVIFISADHGLAVFYFLMSDIIPALQAGGAEIVVLTEDASCEAVATRYGATWLAVESLRLSQLHDYTRGNSPSVQWWLDFLRRAGAARGTNLAVVDAYINQVRSESSGRRRQLFPAMEGIAQVMRRSKPARQACNATKPATLRGFIKTCSPNTCLHWSSPPLPAFARTASCCAKHTLTMSLPQQP